MTIPLLKITTMDKTLQTLQNWFSSNRITCYEIIEGSNKIFDQDFDDTNAAWDSFIQDYETLSNGRYRAKGMKKAGGDRGAVFFNFQKGESQSSTMSEKAIGDRIQQAIEHERTKWEYEALVRRFADLEKDVKEVKETQKKIIDILKDLTDGDDDNDNSAISTITKLAENADAFSKLSSTFKGLKLS